MDAETFISDSRTKIAVERRVELFLVLTGQMALLDSLLRTARERRGVTDCGVRFADMKTEELDHISQPFITQTWTT
ncbi:MAG: hypothetical protein WBV31_18065 [Terriglobales bacterium]|jgi:hypothetical protein